MKKIITFLWVAFCFFSASFSSADEIFLDQPGYLAAFPKIAIVAGGPGQFKICDVKGRVLLVGEKGPVINDPDTGKKVAEIDFSRIAAQGEYYLYFGKVRRDLTIAENPYKEILAAVQKSFNLQRCGQCHKRDAYFLPSTGKSGQKEVKGGWHDAGDYGKYVPPANYAASTLLFSGQLKKTGIRYELDWLLKMQEVKSGGVYHKVTGKNFEPFILPDRDREPRYISRISSAATAGFAGTMAQASRAFRKDDPRYADKLLKAARLAWRFLEKNPAIVPPGGFDNDPEIKTGVYGDTVDGDERLFAAVQLLGATGDPKYRAYFAKHYRNYDPGNTSRLGWQDFRHHAYISYLLLPEKLTSAEVRAEVKRRFTLFAEKLIQRGKKNGFGVVLKSEDYRWGSNGLLMDYAKALLFAHRFTGETKFKELALEQLHYILGRNAHDLCFITGFGEKTVTHLHHRPSIAGGLELPGFLAGGPNKNLQDGTIRAAFRHDSPPALVYLDDKDSYSTNENSIYWNASLALVLGWFCE